MRTRLLDFGLVDNDMHMKCGFGINCFSQPCVYHVSVLKFVQGECTKHNVSKPMIRLGH